MSYLIGVFSDRLQAEAAYTALEQAKVPQEQMAILGRGYKSADEFGFIDPQAQARKQIRFMAIWLVPFGFAGGFVFNSITQIYLFDWTGPMGNHIIGGVLGAIGGAMGSFFVGGGVGLTEGGGDALVYRNRLDAGKYLVVVEGSKILQDRATPILQQENPESLQGYVEN
ncbi:MAG: hypothetical protein F6J87_18140 [Spirulina sp. SIO3F2]|nr:hypothetical protein [Spirulina sp. SIO3F2]